MGNKNGSVYVYKEKRVVVYMNIFCKQVTKKGLIILYIISHSKTIFQPGSQVFFNKAADRSRLDRSRSAAVWLVCINIWSQFSTQILSSVRVMGVSSVSLVVGHSAISHPASGVMSALPGVCRKAGSM